MLPIIVSTVSLQCIREVSLEYHVPEKLIISVLNVERGKTGFANRNKNGTYDLGLMQINTSWWPTLYSYGITPQQVLFDPCINVKVGTWILGKALADGQNVVVGLGNYHSHTEKYNHNYSQQVRVTYTHLTAALSS